MSFINVSSDISPELVNKVEDACDGNTNLLGHAHCCSAQLEHRLNVRISHQSHCSAPRGIFKALNSHRPWGAATPGLCCFAY